MQRQQISRTSSSDELNDSSLSRVIIHSAEQTTEHTLPLSITPSASPLMKTIRRSTHTQTLENIQSSLSTKSIPSFAETQLLSVYYPSQNPKNSSKDDKCIFIEQQDRQPIRYRTTYDPLSSTKSTQTSLPSTHSSTLIIDENDQYLKIHSTNQRLSTNFNHEYSLSNERIDQSKYSYEEYNTNLNKNQSRTSSSSSSSSSVTTVIAQNEELDSDQTSHVTFDDINTQSSTSSTLTNQEQPISNNNQRISSWPPVPDEISLILNQHENDEQKRSTRVQFAEQLIHVIPPSTTNSLEEESLSPPAIIPRTNINDSVNYPINQSKWIKTHMDNSDIQTNSISNRVDTLRSLFEQQNTHMNSSTNQIRRIEPEEKPSKHGVEIRFRVNDPNTSTIYHAEPAKVLPHTEKSSIIIPQEEQQSNSPFKLDQIRQITGKPLKNLDEIGHYLPDGYTWQWNEIFWLSLTISQRDQLKDLEQQFYSRRNDLSSSSSSSNETKQFKSTINVTGAGAWQQNKSPLSTSSITKYTEINTIDETQTSVSVFSSTPSSSYLRVNSQESIASSINQNKRTDSQLTIIESGYNSADDQQRFRPNSSTIIEESLHHIDSNNNQKISSEQSKLDPLSYEQFIVDYLSTHAKYLRSNNGTLILFIDGQQIHMSNISLPSSNENIILAKNIYLDAINYDLLPFETELNQLVIFISGEPIILPPDRWLVYKEKYKNAQWIQKLKRINRNIPSQLIPIIEQWLSDHTTLEFDRHELNVDGLRIPLIGRSGLHILDLHQIRQLETNYWNEILKYLIRIGYVSYDANQRLIHIAHSELDARRLLKSPSPELIEYLVKHLRLLKNIHFHNENGSLIITGNFLIPNEYVQDLFLKYQQGEDLDINELANLLLQICEIEEDKNNQSLILIFNNQTLKLINEEKIFDENHIQILTQWLEQLNQQKLIDITEQNDIIIYPNDQQQQIFIKHEHIDTYMETKSNSKQTEIINMNHIAHILLLYNYVQYSSGQLKYSNQNIQLDTNEFLWLQSIIHSIRTIDHTQQTEIELFDGQQTQIFQIPYENMSPTNNPRIIANYLLQNGNIQFYVNTGQYAYRYVSPDEKTHSVERSSQHELLSSHIRDIHIDKNNQQIEVEFFHDPNNFLQLPSNWYQEIFKHNFDRSYIIDMLLKNGGIINEDNFIFNNHSYSLKFLSKEKQTEKENLIDYYVEFINNQDGIKYDNTNHLLLLENSSDGSKLYLTSEHTQFIHKHQYRKQDMKYLLNKSSEIKQDKFNNWLLYYNNQCIQIPSIEKPNEQVEIHHSEFLDRYHRTIDYMYNHNLIIYNQNLNILQIHFSNQILTIPINQLQSIMNNNNNLPVNSYELSQWLLNNSDRINNYPDGYIQLIYKNKFYDLPLIDPKLELLFPFNKSLRLIQKTPSTTTLDIQQPTEENNYTIDPLLILSNYIYRAGTIYQDEFGRLVIKLNKDEIVIPQSQARNSIEAINTSPNRTGTIIARLIDRIGKVQSNKTGGLIITIGKNSLELSKDIIDQSKTNLNLSIENLTLNPFPITRSKSSGSLSSSSIGHSEFSDDQRILDTKKSRSQTSLYLKPRLLIMHDDDENDGTTRFYIQYTYENDRNSNSVMMLPSRYPVRPTQPRLIAPQHYRDQALREASVYVYRQNENEVHYENLAQYLSTKQTDLSSYTVRRMLKFLSDDEYFTYLNKQMSAIHAQKLVQESEELPDQSLLNSTNMRIRTSDREINLIENNNNQQRSRSSSAFYNVQNGKMINHSNIDEEQQQQQQYKVSSKFIDRSSSSSTLSRSPQTTNSQSLTTPEKNITLPRSTTLSGQSNDGESESRATVSRSASAAAKVVTSKSDTMKSNTSSSAASSREHPVVSSSSTVVRTQSLVSPNRTSGSKGGGDEIKKEKKSKFRTPSFLRKRKEKKEAANKDKVEK